MSSAAEQPVVYTNVFTPRRATPLFEGESYTAASTPSIMESNPRASLARMSRDGPPERILRERGNVSCFRKARTYAGMINASPWYHRLFVYLVLSQVLILIVDRLVLVVANLPDYAASGEADAEYRQAAWLCIVVVVSSFFSAYFGIHAILACNPFELLTFFATMVALIVRNLVAISECEIDLTPADKLDGGGVNAPESAVCYSFMGLSCLLCLSTMVLVKFMYRDLVWIKYKAIGAEVSSRIMYRRYEIFCAVLKLDVQFSLVTLITGLIFFTFENRTAHFATAINAVLFVVEIVWERCGSKAVHNEDRLRMYAFWTMSIFLPAFVINCGIQYRLLLKYAISSPAIFATVAAFAVIAVLNRIATVALSITLYRNFGRNYRGLRRILEGGGPLEKFEKVTTPHMELVLARATTTVHNPTHHAAFADSSTRAAYVVEEVVTPHEQPESAPELESGDYMNAIDRFIGAAAATRQDRVAIMVTHDSPPA